MTTVYNPYNKVLFNALESESNLSEAIYSFVSGVCGNRFLEKEVPFINTNGVSPKTRRLDYVERFSRLVRGYELKLQPFTAKDISDTFGEKAYYEILRRYIKEYDASLGRTYQRRVEFILLAPHPVNAEVENIISLMPEIRYMDFRDYCAFWYKKALKNKYRHNRIYLMDLALNRYSALLPKAALDWTRKEIVCGIK